MHRTMSGGPADRGRDLGRVAALAVTAALIVAACTGGGTSPAPTTGATPPDGATPPTDAMLTFLSTQFAPVEEAEKVRSEILTGFTGGEVDFIGEEEGPLLDRLRAEAQAGSGSVDVVGALHGTFVTVQGEELLGDLTELAGRLQGVNQDYTELGKLGTDRQLYIPWVQATYIMVAKKEALQYLPAGADINALTYDQLAAWGKSIQDATGQQKLGFPGGERGLFHRFMQGHAYPSYTGTEVVGFKTDEAVTMYDSLKDIWQSVHPQFLAYEFMQEPLLSGEVWVAWDHVARHIEALRQRPDDFVTFPAPAGPAGRGYMPVIAGLAIPESAPNRAAAEALIEYLLQPDTQVKFLEQVAFFPVVEGADPGALDPGIQLEADAVAATQEAPDALPALLPVGVGDRGGELNKVYRDAFTRIVVNGEDARTVLDAEGQTLQGILDDTGAACWPPDPASDGPCQLE